MLKNSGKIGEMTIESKCALITGAGDAAAEVPELAFGDAAACGGEILSPAALARTWDAAEVETAMAGVAVKAAATGVNVLRIPCVGVSRGESTGFSEDPYLAGKTAAACARGVQQTGISACVCGYPLEPAGRSVKVDERALREIYMTPTEIALRESGARCVAFGNGKLNGMLVSRNVRFATGVLRREWDFGGAAICETSGQRQTHCALSAGVDIVRPAASERADSQEAAAAIAGAAAYYEKLAHKDSPDGNILSAAVRAGEAVDPAVIDVAADRAVGLAEASRYNGFQNFGDADSVAAAAVVLLKNKNNALPLARGAQIALAGLPDTLADFNAAAVADATVLGSAGGFDDAAVKGACLLAEKADAVVVFVACTADGDPVLPEGQTALLKALKATGKRLVAVLTCDRAADTSWDADCDALLLAGGLGARTANAALAAVVGAREPTGRLAESLSPAGKLPRATDTDKEGNVLFTESVFVGYRRYQKEGVAVKYPFGFGLGYTEYAYSDLTVGADGVTFYIKNKGARDGTEVAQLYVGKSDSAVVRPVKELKGYAKVFVRVGETVKVTIPFDNYTFRYYNVKTGKWEIEAGEYELCVGPSSAKAALMGRKTMAGTGAAAPYASEKLPSYAAGNVGGVGKKEYEKLLAFDAGIDLDVARRVARRKKMIAALIIAVAMIAVDLLLTGFSVVPIAEGPIIVLCAVNFVLYAFVLLIVCVTGNDHVPPSARMYMSPATKEDNAYMIFSEISEPVASAASDAALDAAASVAPGNNESIKVPFAGAAAVNAYCAAEKVSFAELCARFVSFAAARGLTVAVADARMLFAAMAGARFVVLKNAAPQVSARLAAAVAAFFGGSGQVIAAGADATADGLVAALAPTAAAADKTAMTVVTLNGVDPAACGCCEPLLPFVRTPVRPAEVRAADGAATLSGGLWFFAVPAAGANYRAFPRELAAVSAAVEIAAVITADTDGAANAEPISYDTWKGAVRAAKETFYVREELWKKLDRLEEWADGKAGFTIGNKLFRRAEDFTSTFMACGGEDTEALDAAIAAMIVPELAAYADAPFRDGENGLTETLDRLFGADNIAVSQTAVKRLGID